MGRLPTGENVQRALCAAGIQADIPACSSALAVALSSWETETGWFPFVAESAAAEFPVHVPGASPYAIIDLGGGILPTGTPAVTLDGAVLVSGTDYQLAPVDAARRRVPYTYLKFLNRRISASSGPLLATGRWGYCDEASVPSDAYNALLSQACLRIASSAVQASASTGDTTRAASKDNGDGETVEIATSVTERTAALTRWESSWKTGVKNYRRMAIQ